MQNPYEPLQDSEFMDFTCPDCGSPVSFPVQEAGSIKECPTCLEAIVVPQPGASVGEKLTLPISTPRLILRRLQNEDWKDLAELLSNEDTLRLTIWERIPVEEVEQWLEKDHQVRFPQKDRDVCFAIHHVQKQKLIGLAQFWYFTPLPDQAQFLLILHPNFQRQGYGTEAAKGLLRFGFQGLRLHRIIAECDSRDTAGRALLNKAGLRLEAEFIKDRYIKDQWVNTLSFAMLQEEFHRAG